MLWDYPLIGIGQGNFLRDSIFYNHLNDSNLSLDYGGENAHNYFLQTLAENGIIGACLFFIAVFIPIIKIRNLFNPAVLAIIALFLGNIYAHSFLIRDNLFLATIFLSLIYLELNQNENISFRADQAIQGHRSDWAIKAMAGLIFIGLLSLEIYHSFFKYPFTYGRLCQMNTPVSPDGWTSGLAEIALPKNAKGLSIPFTMDRIDRQSRDINVNFAIASASGAIISTKNINLSRVNSQEIAEINIAMPTDAAMAQLDGNKVIISVSSCLTPINLGIKPDLRRLGIQIQPPIFIF
jgi:O-antigen ligase